MFIVLTNETLHLAFLEYLFYIALSMYPFFMLMTLGQSFVILNFLTEE